MPRDINGIQRIAKRNIKGAFNLIVGGYYNCVLDGDDSFKKLSREELADEKIYESALSDTYLGAGCVLYNKPMKEIRFAGKEFCYSVIESLMNKDSDVSEICNN